MLKRFLLPFTRNTGFRHGLEDSSGSSCLQVSTLFAQAHASNNNVDLEAVQRELICPLSCEVSECVCVCVFVCPSQHFTHARKTVVPTEIEMLT